MPPKRITAILINTIDNNNVHTLHSKASDTTLFHIGSQLQGTSSVTDSTNYEQQLSQNPTKALFKSMLIPGWGQYGNKKKFKALVYLSFDIWMISKALDHKKKANDLWDKFQSFDDVASRNTYHALYNSERNRRNKYTWYAVITSFISMFDAYVDAHLSGFPKEKESKISIDFKPTDENLAALSISIRL